MDNMDSDSISSEGSSGSAVCLRHRPSTHQQLWDKEDVILSLTNLPAGEAALTVLPTLCGEPLDKVADELKEKTVSQSADLSVLIPRFANGYVLMHSKFIALQLTPARLTREILKFGRHKSSTSFKYIQILAQIAPNLFYKSFV